MLRCGSLLVVLALIVPPAYAQTAPPPPQPFPPVIESYTGRLLDSSDRERGTVYSDFTAWARGVVVAPEIDRVYFLLNFGSWAVYRLSTLEARLAASEPPATLAHGEKMLTPLHSSMSTAPFWFDTTVEYDDRGYTYLAPAQVTILDPSFNVVGHGPAAANADQVIIVRSGARYYGLFVSDSYDPVGTHIVDVTNPAAPVLVRTVANLFVRSRPASNGDFVYYLVEGGQLYLGVTNVDRLANAQPPLFQTLSSTFSFTKWVTDGTSFYSVPSNFGPQPMVVLQPQGATYQLITLPNPAATLPAVAPARDFLVIGQYLYHYDGTRYVRVDASYFRDYGTRMEQASPGTGAFVYEMAPVTIGGETFLILAADSLIEMFALRAPPETSHLTDVPTASEWILLALAAMVAVIGVTRLRQ